MSQKQIPGKKRLANIMYSMIRKQNTKDNGCFLLSSFASLYFLQSVFFLLLFLLFHSKIFIVCLLCANHIDIKLIVTLSMLK